MKSDYEHIITTLKSSNSELNRYISAISENPDMVSSNEHRQILDQATQLFSSVTALMHVVPPKKASLATRLLLKCPKCGQDVQGAITLS